MGEEKLTTMRVACVQLSAGKDWRLNLSRALDLARKACRQKAALIAFPENFLWRGPAEDMQAVARLNYQAAIACFRLFAKTNKVSLLLGSLILPSKLASKFRNVSLFISDQGKVLASYEKKHLFDINLPGLKIRESDHFVPGKKFAPFVYKKVKMGLSICYDLRFPELYRAKRNFGAHLYFVPANFTFETGKAHWEVLLRARAIENQAFIVAPAQWGAHPETGVKSYGNSLVVDPWGKILAKMGPRGSGVLTADLHFRIQTQLRKRFPVLRHA